MARSPREYASPTITVSFDAKRCIHAEKCVHGLPGVFERDRRPWIDPSAAGADEIAAVVRRCPTGALTYTRHDGGAEEQAPEVNEIVVEENGPLSVHGDLDIRTTDGPVRTTRAALCRCGASANKPFCDDSHYATGFVAAPPVDIEPKGTEAGGPLHIAMRENGSLKVEGHFTVRAASGTPVPRGPRTSLCRCGHSNTKPFCDGAHRDAGFTAPGSAD